MFRKMAIVTAISTIVGATLLPAPSMAGRGGWHGHFEGRGHYAHGYRHFGRGYGGWWGGEDHGWYGGDWDDQGQDENEQ